MTWKSEGTAELLLHVWGYVCVMFTSLQLFILQDEITLE